MEKSLSLELRQSEANTDTIERVCRVTPQGNTRARGRQALRKRACARTRDNTRSAKSTKVSCPRKFVFLRVVRTVLFGNGNFNQANGYGFVHCSNRDGWCFLSAWFGGRVLHPVCSCQPYLSSMLDCRAGREHFNRNILSHSTWTNTIPFSHVLLSLHLLRFIILSGHW